TVNEITRCLNIFIFFFFQAEDGIRDFHVTGVQTCALPISLAGCNRDANDTADRDTTPATDTTGATGDMPPATTDTSAMDTDATTGLTVTTVDLGSAVGSDNRISTPDRKSVV